MGMIFLKYEFIGVGNMASAIIRGLVKKNPDINKNIFVYDKELEKARSLANELGLNIYESIDKVGIDSDYLVLAVKPHIIEVVLKDIQGNLKCNEGLTIVSIAAGKSLEFIENSIGFKKPIIRVMPNVNSMVSESVSAICGNQEVSEKNLKDVSDMFNAVGKSFLVEERLFSGFSAIAGASPAFVYLFIDSLARAGVRAGFDKKTALEIASQAVFGSAKTVMESTRHPFELIDMVCSPGGTTIEGMKSLFDDGLESAVMNAVSAVIEKDKKL